MTKLTLDISRRFDGILVASIIVDDTRIGGEGKSVAIFSDDRDEFDRIAIINALRALADSVEVARQPERCPG